jgi:hypothetical protein
MFYRRVRQFFGSQTLDEAHVPLFGAFGATWEGAVVARRSANPLGMLRRWMRCSGRRGRKPPPAGLGAVAGGPVVPDGTKDHSMPHATYRKGDYADDAMRRVSHAAVQAVS